MSTQSRQQLLTTMYKEVFQDANPAKIREYYAADYVQDTNYDVLDYDDFVEHVKSLETGPEVSFKLEFLAETPEKVIVRTQVIEEKRIAGAPPMALLISVWEFNNENKICRCWEVMGDD